MGLFLPQVHSEGTPQGSHRECSPQARRERPGGHGWSRWPWGERWRRGWPPTILHFLTSSQYPFILFPIPCSCILPHLLGILCLSASFHPALLNPPGQHSSCHLTHLLLQPFSSPHPCQWSQHEPVYGTLCPCHPQDSEFSQQAHADHYH